MSKRIYVAAVYVMAFGPMMQGQSRKLLQISPGVEQFNATGVGSTVTNSDGITVSNLGTSPVTISDIGVTGPNAGDFSVQSGCPSSLNPGYACYLTVSCTPSATGVRAAQLVVKNGGATQTALLVGEGLAATKAVSFTPPQAVFPDTAVGLPSQNAPTAYIQVSNTGNVPLNIRLVKIGGGNVSDFQITSNYCNGYAVPPGAYCSVNVSFSPTALGNRQSNLEVVDDAPASPQKVPLLGVGTTPTNSLQLFPTAVAFAPTGTTSNEQATVTLQNTGTESIVVNSFQVLGPNATDFSIAQNFCGITPFTLLPFNQCQLWVQFAPGAYGTRLANLEVQDSVAGSPQTVPMEGIGALPVSNPLKFTQNPENFGVQVIGYTSSGSVTLENLGSYPAQISLQVTGLAPGDFYVYNYCTYLNAGGSCYYQINFTPSAVGLRLARLTATDAVSGASQSVELIGSGEPSSVLNVYVPTFSPTTVGTTVTASMSISSNSYSPVTVTSMALSGGNAADFTILENTCPIGTPLNYCQLTLNFTPRGAGVRVTQLEITYAGGSAPISMPVAAFGEPSSRSIAFNETWLNLGTPVISASTTASATIQNSGTVAVTIDGISISGTQAGDYSITENSCPQKPATLAASATCQVSLQFTPAALGPRLARLQVTDNAAGSPQNLPLVGFGAVAGAPSLQISPASLNFNPQALGSPYQLTIGLSTFSPNPVTFSSIQIVGANSSDFSLVSNCPTTLTQYYVCDLYVTFTPSVTGLRIAAVQLQDNATGSPQLIPLAGMGVIGTQSVSFNPNPLVFSQMQGIGYSANKMITIFNTGNENVLVSGIRVLGRNAGDFGIESNSCPLNPAPLPAGGSCQVTIAFTPSATGVRLATFAMMDSAAGGSQSISMVGEGTAAVKTLQVNPPNVTFYPESVGYTEYGPQITITNTGTVPVTFKGFSLGGPNASDFTMGYNYCLPYSGPAILNPGSSCSLTVNFTPSATGTRTGQLNITSDASNGPLVVSLIGTGQ